MRPGGKGPPSPLLHGNPMTHDLAQDRRSAPPRSSQVVAARSRGYGDSVGPEGKAARTHKLSSARGLRTDREHGAGSATRASRAGHDRGHVTVNRRVSINRSGDARCRGRHPAEHKYLDPHFDGMGNEVGHWIFMAQTYDMPERMMVSVRPMVHGAQSVPKPGIGRGFFRAAALE